MLLYQIQGMATVIEMDENISLGKQLQQDVNGGVVLIITFTVNPEDEEQFVKTWAGSCGNLEENIRSHISSAP